MIECIILGEKGIRVRNKFNRGYRPYGGFQRDRSGNFVKQDGDPRCITEKEIQAELNKQVTSITVKQKCVSCDNSGYNSRGEICSTCNSPQPRRHALPPLQATIDQRLGVVRDIPMLFDCEYPISVTALGQCLHCDAYASCNDSFVFFDPKVKKPTGIEQIDMYSNIAKIACDLQYKKIRVFFNKNERFKPDIIIKDAIISPHEDPRIK